MIIGIDGNEANQTVRVGVGQYAYHMITKLYQIDQTNEYFIYLKNSPMSDMPTPRKNWHYRVFGPGKLWTKIALPIHLYCDGLKLDLFFSPSHYSPHFSPFPTVPTIHDLGYLLTPDQFTKKDFYQLVEWTKHSLLHAKHIIAVSQFTKNDLIKTYNIPADKISIAQNGVEPPSENVYDQNVLTKFGIIKPYFLALGTLKPNKNYPFLISAFSKFLKDQTTDHNKFQLVIAGKKGWLFDSIFTAVQDLGLEKQVIFTDYISEIEKWTLLKSSISLVIPSIYEGFGIPAIESQSVGTPVISSDIPSLKEVLEDTAIFIDPSNEVQLVNALIDVQKPKIRQTLIEIGSKQSIKYTWENSANSLLKAFNAI
jgi:glycosyltransferase involved in cell wall biosynthesis